MQPPDGARHLAPPRPPLGTQIVATPTLGGLHHRYGFVAVPDPLSTRPYTPHETVSNYCGGHQHVSTTSSLPPIRIGLRPAPG